MLRTLETQASVPASHYDRLSCQIDVWHVRLAKRLAMKHLGDLAEGCHDEGGN